MSEQIEQLYSLTPKQLKESLVLMLVRQDIFKSHNRLPVVTLKMTYIDRTKIVQNIYKGMALEMIVGVNVVDDKAYQEYRQQMVPILKSYGGEFGYDFKVSEVLKSSTERPINRVFTIYFSNEDAMNSFFSNPEYLKIKQRYFEKSVTATTVIATYERE